MENENNTLEHRHRNEEPQEDRFLRLRNILNIIFMIGAIIGLIVYLTGNHPIGTIIILASMVFKIVECCLRFLKK